MLTVFSDQMKHPVLKFPPSPLLSKSINKLLCVSCNRIRNRDRRKAIVSALACIVVALVIAFAMIAVLFATRDTTTYREMSV